MPVTKNTRELVTNFCYFQILKAKKPLTARELLMAFERRYLRPKLTVNQLSGILKGDKRFRRVKLNWRFWAWDIVEGDNGETIL